MKKLILPLMILSLFITSCGSKKEESPTLTPDNRINLNLTAVDNKLIGLSSKKFHDTGKKLEVTETHIITLRLSISPLNNEGSFNVESFITIFSKDEKSEVAYGSDVVDFLVLIDSLLVLELNDKRQYVLTALSLKGKVLNSKLFIDDDLKNDICYKDLAFFKKCPESFDGSVRPYSHYVPYQFGVLKKANLDDKSFFMLIDTGALSTNLYKVKIQDNEYKITKKKQLQANVNLQFPMPIFLTGGYEFLTLNRFGRHMQKIFDVTNEDQILFGMNIITSDGINKFVNREVEESEALFYLIKLDEDFIKEFETFHPTIMTDYQDYLLSAGIKNKKLYFGVTTSRNVPNGQFDFNLHTFSTDTGEKINSNQVHLAGGDYLSSIGFRDDKLVTTSFSGVGQNPQGMSISGFGAIAFTEFTMDLEAGETTYFKMSSRKDIVQDFVLLDDKIIALVDQNGPVTHTADNDIELGRQSTSVVELEL